jgi:hypothetical protein
MNKNQEVGRKFEEYIHSILLQTNLPVLTEKEIRNKYISYISGIDHLILGKEYYIAIQDKYVRSRKPSNVDFNHFKCCVNDLSRFTNTKIIGIYLSLLNPTSYAVESFNFENSLNRNKFVFINNENPNKLVHNLIEFLYTKNIYLYEGEDIIMIDKNF